MAELPHKKFPCRECPFRRDVEPGQFSSERYEALRSTVGGPGREQGLGAPVFACHKTEEGKDAVCAGWLAVCGVDHLGIRVAVASGRLNGEALSPGPDWPELFDDYEEVAQTQGVDPY